MLVFKCQTVARLLFPTFSLVQFCELLSQCFKHFLLPGYTSGPTEEQKTVALLFLLSPVILQEAVQHSVLLSLERQL